ncbi:lateral signaling target protein 2-like [Watersipora subatra]|uniref:lateral signaling target protein 2-like n=1 Tax=Watersipora subatra TaxID=2589382 RepID=UPI00355B4194
MLGLTRKLLYSKPKKTDSALLAQFYHADVDLCTVAAELDSFDGRKNPARCAALVAQLRQYQDHVLRLIQSMMEEVVPEQRASRDFRIKYPEDLIQDGLAGQLWFGAECLAAGSSILNREIESESMRPLAKSLTKQLDQLRRALRDQSTRDPLFYPDKIKSAFIKFDESFAEFELSYVTAMVPVKTVKEYDMSQEVTVLFSETVSRALAHGLITGDMLEYYDPVLMFTIPRLAIVTGLVFFPQGPLNPDRRSQDLSELFRPFQSLLKRIRELLWTLTQNELRFLERLLCNLEQAAEEDTTPVSTSKTQTAELDALKTQNASPSLFNDISNVQSFNGMNSESSRADDFRAALFNMLDGLSYPTDQAAGSASEQPADLPPELGNNNLSQTTNTSDNSTLIVLNETIQPLTELSNEPNHAIARIDMPSTRTREQNPSHTSVTSRSRRAKRQQSADPTTSQPLSSEFVFNLPDGAAQDVDDMEVSAFAGPSQVTLHRSVSNILPGRVTNLTIDDESTDSSEISMSDFETSSGSESPTMRHKQLSARPLGDEKADSLRGRYRNAQELLHKLFVCISGVADQLQSNFACDLRNILKCVFELHTGDDTFVDTLDKKPSAVPQTSDNESEPLQAPPAWVPDSEMDKCCSCRLPFTVIRRRHHCRNCGLIFCARCSANSAPLPNYGYEQAVRICNLCYVYRINPFFMDDSTQETYNSASRRQQS